jgi:hypothetical protein
LSWLLLGSVEWRCPMTIIPDLRSPYHEPPPSMLDTVAGSLRALAAVLGTVLLIWILVGFGGRSTDSRLADSVDPDAVPLVAMQAVGPAD